MRVAPASPSSPITGGKLRSTSPLEPLKRQLGRRTDVAGIFLVRAGAALASVERALGAI
jgi:hypothetical protein